MAVGPAAPRPAGEKGTRVSNGRDTELLNAIFGDRNEGIYGPRGVLEASWKSLAEAGTGPCGHLRPHCASADRLAGLMGD